MEQLKESLLVVFEAEKQWITAIIIMVMLLQKLLNAPWIFQAFYSNQLA